MGCRRQRRPGPGRGRGRGSRAVGSELHAWLACVVPSSPRAVTRGVRSGRGECAGCLPAAATGAGGRGARGSRAVGSELHAWLACVVTSSPRAVTRGVRSGRGECAGCCRQRRPGPGRGRGSRAVGSELHAWLACVVPSSPRAVTRGVRSGRGECAGCCRQRRPGPGAGPGPGLAAVGSELHAWLACVVPSSPRAVTRGVRSCRGECAGCWRQRRPGPGGPGPGLAGRRVRAACLAGVCCA